MSSSGEPARRHKPDRVAADEELAATVSDLVDEVARLRREVAEARAWAWSDYHRTLVYDWVEVAGRTYDGTEATLPEWMIDPTEPDQQAWWPRDDASGGAPQVMSAEERSRYLALLRRALEDDRALRQVAHVFNLSREQVEVIVSDTAQSGAVDEARP